MPWDSTCVEFVVYFPCLCLVSRIINQELELGICVGVFEISFTDANVTYYSGVSNLQEWQAVNCIVYIMCIIFLVMLQLALLNQVSPKALLCCRLISGGQYVFSDLLTSCNRAGSRDAGGGIEGN